MTDNDNTHIPGEDHGQEQVQHGIPKRSALWNLASDLEQLLETGMVDPETRPPVPPAPAPRHGVSKNSDRPGHGEGDAGAFDGWSLEQLHEHITECRACELHRERKHAVPGEGDRTHTRLMVIGEGPGAEEDARGLPFVGNAGKYLDKWLSAIDMSRENGVFITNTVKCRPPGNRDPRPEETSACLPYLHSQIKLLKPDAILCVGRISASILLDRDVKITRERGRWFRFMDIPLMATFHPSAVLRDSQLRRPVWEDMKKLKNALDSGHFSDEP